MLDSVNALELIPVTIETKLRPYMKEHKLNEDKVLYQYIGVQISLHVILKQNSFFSRQL